MTKIPHRLYLSEDEIPRQWYNLRADMKEQPDPMINPATMQPATVEDLYPVFCTELAQQEMDSTTRYFDIPEEILDVYKMYRPSPLIRAYNLEKALDTPAKIYYKFEGNTTIDRELLQISLYLDLQLKCFKKSFTYRINAPENCDKYIIPSFILQPLIENSIIHGFSQINREGRIDITIVIENDISITVKDNGTGIRQEILDSLNANNYHSQKYGIRNVINRIKTICGDEYGITFSSSGDNTTAVIKLPIIKKEDNDVHTGNN